MTLEEEEERATELLQGKVVNSIKRFNENEVIIKFDEGIEILIYGCENGVDLSIADSYIEENKTI